MLFRSIHHPISHPYVVPSHQNNMVQIRCLFSPTIACKSLFRRESALSVSSCHCSSKIAIPTAHTCFYSNYEGRNCGDRDDVYCLTSYRRGVQKACTKSPGASIKSLKETWLDTTTPQGKLLFTIFARFKSI